jgi:TorA maturation chaperone TorD
VEGQVDNEILEVLADRGATYALLSRLFQEEISTDLLQQLVADLTQPGSPDDAAGEGYALLRRFAQEAQHRDLREVWSELSVEYAGLFLTGRKGSIPPFESVYTSEEQLLMQRARDVVLAAYRAENLARTRVLKEPEDHVAVELEFMALLCEKARNALADGQTDAALALLDKQKTFLEEHLLVWVPRLSQDVAEATHSDFYRGLASLTQEHLAQERATINDLCERARSLQS